MAVEARLVRRSDVLLTFRVANHRSIRDEQELSLVATEFNDGSGREAHVRVAGRAVSVLPAIGVFGANASGKSNALAALRFMRTAVLESFADWGKHPETVPREPFALDPSAREETSLFEVELLLGQPGRKTRYTYGFELSDERVEAEWLHAYPKGSHRQVWFDREAGRPEDEGGEIRFPGSGLRGRKDEIKALTRPNALFLTVAATLNHRELVAVHRWFVNNLWLVTSQHDVENRTEWTRERLTGQNTGIEFRERLIRLLAGADLGITGLTTDPDTGEVQLLHRTPQGVEQPLDFWRQESLGTQAWFAFLGPLLHALDRGGILLADELDSSLHPRLAAEVIRLFQDPDANPRTAQLIFTTHDATLLGPTVAERPLDRDQIWITVKDGTGQSTLYPLVAAKVRKDDNLERRYLNGHYGGVPRVGAGEFARTLASPEGEEKATA
ncbi:ATP-binding protein [Streptomyces brevispora]|uniref:ATP-binding protein n=1 Tax=Streptomyces brevispora TaxID=887462 RepID=A0ABZ1G552_9ACTN|nr:ATP-binding protein [Streptomyces brevispora]WSC14957.1 ATP-binding protein [Streptomyces brevispora]